MDETSTAHLVALRLRALRARRGWSARELAEACARDGVSSLTRVAIAKIETGHRGVSVHEVAVLARALGVTPDDLVMEFSDVAVAWPSRSARSGRSPYSEPGITTHVAPVTGRDDKLHLAQVPVAELVAELRSLRKGRGLLVRHVRERLGPRLRAFCAVRDDDSYGEIRRKVADQLESLASELPEDLRVAVLAAFAIHHQARHPFYKDRVRWLAGQLCRDERTARRRIDEGIERLAELAASTPDSGVARRLQVAYWYTEELRVALLLDQPLMEALEFRRIVAKRDGLDRLDLNLSMPAPSATSADAFRGPNITVLYGGTLLGRSDDSAGRRVAFTLALPQPLRINDKHEFGLRYQTPRDQAIQPHYLYVPKDTCDLLDLRIRFDVGNPPLRVWRLAEAVFGDHLDPGKGEPLTLDPAGEIHLTFRHLRPGLTYGAAWRHD
jgi:transcriptional regulator with XRE-family HTH domain